MTKNNSICDISNCALAYRHPGSDEPLCYDQHNPNNCPVIQKLRRSTLEAENTEFDYGHNIKLNNISEDDA